MKDVITRFAPSPTGYLHIGGVRTALISWAYAKKHNGQFILRIEDTDKERSTPQAIEAIKDGIQWLELINDGPIYFQTQRIARYSDVIKKMLEDGHAYYCYSSKEELDQTREDNMKLGKKPKYDGKWRPENNKTLPDIPEDIKPVIRFKNPIQGSVTWVDLVKGKITINNEELDDFIIARSDGSPTYNFCVVIDDWDMKITHVIRGDDHINNTPRQINLLAALEAPIPHYAHLSMILGEDGQKLSKRHGAVSVMTYKDHGYLPEALKNYLARLGWSHGDDEIFDMSELCEWFDFKNVTSSSAQFSKEKLDWINNYYIKNKDTDELSALIKKILLKNKFDNLDDKKITDAINLFKERANNLNELAQNLAFFFKPPKASKELIKKYFNQNTLELLSLFFKDLEGHGLSEATIDEYIKSFVKLNEIKFPSIAMPLRIIIVGTDQSPSVGSIISILSIDESLRRYNEFLKQYD
ncbi:MAG: glutamate--tRNA ligase [Methylophilaceae bacterium]|nr:glutamate--tRNA ligase [Methylophilaceae bacterium]